NKVGIHDNFFQMGGHSLLGTLLMSRVCDAFNTDLSLRNLFESPTIAGLARTITQHQIEQANAQEIAAALRELDKLSDEEVMALLASEEEVKADKEKGSAGLMNLKTGGEVRS
ncbi:MAG: phosphopantetheine-binding protein, partial [Acidobacteria bacterium]|nr:phosphopantetheine-binding protein [Acidobacteriota bacterium]